jgi:class 3 adenylate cyclase/predicted ATPase
MRCQNCGIENAAGSRFCNRCGTPLNKRCLKCGSENATEAVFCSQCGAAIDAPGRMRAAELRAGPAERGSSLTGERRHLTVLFCDLVNSTSISAQLDPEEWREIVADYHRAAAQAIERFGGHVAQYLGDGVMAYFGYPEAHDNDAERAARAGLAILDAISKLNQPSTRPELSARIGIDSGAVVVGASAGKDADVFGDTPNIAARVQAAAEPGTVMITDATHRLVSGLFVVDQLAAQALKRIERPVQLYRVIQPSGVRGRLAAAAASRGLTPFVGREDDLRMLMSRWERALDGEGQVALIIGEAGIGKSRLLQRFHEQVGGTPHTWIEAGAGAFFQNTPFYPVTELLQQFLGGNGSKPAEEQLAQLEPRLELAGLNPAETIPLIAPLLNLQLPPKYPPLPLSPEQRRGRLLATLVDWVLGAARVQPLVVATEDLHWVDPSTLELIQLLVEQGVAARLLLLYTARPEFHPQWPLRGHHTQITLNRLSNRDVREMITQVAARNALASESVDAVIERTGGVPLFVEELTRAVLESANTGLSGREIPVTLQDSLMARLDRLGSAKEVIQVGAVIGSEFSYELLHAVHPLAEDDLQHALRGLADAELLYARGIAPEATYLFKHALIRDAAYEALLRSKRRRYHRKIAEVLQERFSDTVEVQPELLATHYTEAGLIEQAVPFWQRAGQRALERSANQEAIRHLNKGLELLSALPETPEHLQQELLLQVTLGAAVMVVKGFASLEAQSVYAGARKLCQKVDGGLLVFNVFWALWVSHAARAEHDQARDAAEECLRLAQAAQSPAVLLEAHHALGVSLLCLGEFVDGLQHLEQSTAIYDPQQHAAQAYIYGQDSGVGCLCHGAWALWFLGYPERARHRIGEALALARQVSHPVSTAAAANIASWVYQLLRDSQAMRDQADAAVALSTERGFEFWAAMGVVGQGSAMLEQGLVKDGITQLRSGLNSLRSIGGGIMVPYFLSQLAEAYGKAGQAEDGLSTLAEAMAAVNITRECWWEAELYRLKGELMLKQSGMQSLESEGQTGVEECFSQALSIARAQNAKFLELRATMSFARLLASQGKRDEARTMLAEIYNWFTEGFDTVDLKEAKALLEGLGRTAAPREFKIRPRS